MISPVSASELDNLCVNLACGSDANSFQQTTKWIDEVRSERGTEVIIMLGKRLAGESLFVHCPPSLGFSR